MENRTSLIVDVEAAEPTGRAEHEAALAIIDRNRREGVASGLIAVTTPAISSLCAEGPG